MIRVMTDNAANLPPELREQYGIRELRSSTTNSCRILPQSSDAPAVIVSISAPCCARCAASSTTRPSPSEAPRLSSTRMSRWG